MKIYIKANIVDDAFYKEYDVTEEEIYDAVYHPSDSTYISKRSIADHAVDPEILAKLASDEDYWVRYHVACNPSTDPEIVMQLLDDEEWWVRIGAIEHVNDLSMIDQCVDDPYFAVREKVAQLTRDPQILAQLANDPDPDVSKMARKRLGHGAKSASKNASLQINVGMDFDSTPVVQITLASEADEFASEFEYVDSVSAANGLYAVKFNNEDVQIFKLANSLSNYKSLLKKDYQDHAKQELEEDGEANMLLFLNSYELTVDETECRNATAYVNYALNYIQDTYVDGDSFSCINLLQVSNNNIKVVLAGEDEVIVR